MRIVSGLLLIAIGFVWAAVWSGGAAMSTETGIWSSSTWALIGVAAAGLLPAGLGLYLIRSAFWRMSTR